MSWQALEDGNKELAEFGVKRFASNHVGYLATLRKDGSPRVHPMTPFVGEGHLFFFTHVGSFFWHDLQRDGRYALHCSVENQDGGEGEFFIKGYATLTDDPDLRVIAEKYVPYTDDLEDDPGLFELSVESAFSTVYTRPGIERRRWKKEE
jgi:general stress protein 26